jgi:CheY-like chemotaxis protein
MSYVIVHSNNTSLVTSEHFPFEKCLFFAPDPDKDIDLYISDFISQQITPKMPKAIFIKYALTDNYISFLGIRLAMHIRLAKSTVSSIPIIMLGEETIIEISKLSEIASLIGTSGIYHSNEASETVHQYIEAINNESLGGLKDITAFIDKISIPLPSNYSSHHSVSNEWALLRWSNYFSVKNNEQLEQNIASQLFYKYLLNKFPIYPEKKLTPPVIKGPTSILLIEDQWDKGWNNFFVNYFSNSPTVKYRAFEYDYKSKKSDEIVDNVIKHINEEKIELVLLDLRLCDEDFFESTKTENLTGYKILTSLKNINRGIQVIFISASNKIWNYKPLLKEGSNGYLIKESPENSNNPLFTEKTFSIFEENLELAISQTYLINIYSSTVQIINHLNLKVKNRIIAKEFAGAISSFLKLAFNSIENSADNQFDSAFVYYFLALEAISKQFIDEDNPKRISVNNIKGEITNMYQFEFRSNYTKLIDYVGNPYFNVNPGDTLISNSKRIPYDPKFHNLIAFSGVNNISPIALVALRNKFNHPDLINNKKIAEIKKNDVLELFEVVQALLLKI